MKKQITRTTVLRSTGMINGFVGAYHDVSIATLTAAATLSETDATAHKVHATHSCYIRSSLAGQIAQRERAEAKLNAQAEAFGLSANLSEKLNEIYPLTAR